MNNFSLKPSQMNVILRMIAHLFENNCKFGLQAAYFKNYLILGLSTNVRRT